MCFPILQAELGSLVGAKNDFVSTNHAITVQKNCFTTFFLCQLLKTQGFFHLPFSCCWNSLYSTAPTENRSSPPRTPRHQAVQVVESAVAFALPVIQGATQEDLQAMSRCAVVVLKKVPFFLTENNKNFVGDDMGMMI